MDLVTLVTACALTVDPKIVHALIWHQSGGEPWSFTVPGERQPHVYRNVADAIRAAHATYPADVAIRVGLTGLSPHLDQPPPRCSRRVRTSRSRRNRSHNLPNAARPRHALRAIQSAARLPSIVARGSGRTTASQMPSGHRLRTMTRRTSKCRRTHGSTLLECGPRPSLHSTTPPLHRPLHWTTASAAGRAPSFRPSHDRPTVIRSIVQQATDLQPKRKSLTVRAHIRDPLRRMPTVCLYPGQRSGARNDWNDGVSHDVA
jgi:hypothetical protein